MKKHFDFVNNKDQQKLKEYQQTLRGLQSIHNLRVQKKQMLQKMQQEKKVKDTQDKNCIIKKIMVSNDDLLHEMEQINNSLNISVTYLRANFAQYRQNLLESNCFEAAPPRQKITSIVFNAGGEGSNIEEQIAIVDDFFTQEIETVHYAGPNEIIPGADYFDIEFKHPFPMFDCNRNKNYNDIILSSTIRVIILTNQEDNKPKVISAYPISGEDGLPIGELQKQVGALKGAIELNEFLIPSESRQKPTH